jgi:S-adenosylmethionine-diacylglycerol 3-amino-3-carboxypropyl transferase
LELKPQKSHQYFHGLNYSLANEDSAVEVGLLQQYAGHILCVAGSGARCLPLLIEEPQQMDIVDLSQEQLHLAELRFRSLQAMTYSEWLFFMGYRQFNQELGVRVKSRLQLMGDISLSSASLEFWMHHSELWNLRGFIHLGKWESYFAKVSKFFRQFMGHNFFPLFEAGTLQEQIAIYESTFPHLRFQAFVRIVASEFALNRFLYKGSLRKNGNINSAKFILQEFDRIFRTMPVRKNYFFQVLFLGQIYFEEGLPLEAHLNTYEKAVKTKTKVTFRQTNFLNPPGENYSFFSLSDTLSYLPCDQSKSILQLLKPHAAIEARVVMRQFLNGPEQILNEGWQCQQDLELKARVEDGTGVYQFRIFDRL